MGLSARKTVVRVFPPDECSILKQRGTSQEGLHQTRPQIKNDQVPARDALRTEVTKQTGQNLGGRVLKDSSTAFGWFVRNRYFPLREGDWRPETAKVKKIQIEQDLLAKFEEFPSTRSIGSCCKRM